MLRLFSKRIPSLHALEMSGLAPIATSEALSTQQLISSSAFLVGGSNVECRLYSSLPTGCRRNVSGWKAENTTRGGIANPLNSEKSLLSSCITTVVTEQRRGYWGKEGRIGWRRRRNIERTQREQILNPSSPVIDYKVPWPKDDFESLPSDLFPEDVEELSPVEIRNAQNAVIKSINSQINNQTEGRLFAVVHVNGKQFKVTPEDIIVVQDIFPPTAGDQIRLHKVLLVGGKDFTLLGSPLLNSDLVRIEATVIEKTLSYTKMNFRMIKRENYKRMRFHKTPYTMLRINLIELMQPINMITSDAETANKQSSFVEN